LKDFPTDTRVRERVEILTMLDEFAEQYAHAHEREGGNISCNILLNSFPMKAKLNKIISIF
jgi:hypothetical protein